ncbi:MAG: DUF4159 domain-containing protein [Sedimentisphaerales bacterium]|nr:DUF4159 domain-containing protein [Sedimentisphaerales bacterium]
MKRSRILVILIVLGALGATLALAQRYRYDERYSDPRGGVPNWEPDKEFAHDLFTFVRIRYSSGYGGYGGYGGRGGRRGRGGYGRGGGGWSVDYPDSDLNFSFRLHQLTAMQVHPDGIVLELTDPELFNYPFIYMLEVGALVFSDEEVKALRKYLLSGGFLMVDDFWGDEAWYNFYREIKRVFPEREPVDIPLEDNIFHIPYDLKEKPQIPSINSALAGRPYGITWEDHGPGSQTPHFRAIYDDKGRMMVVICHNTDLGDGWEEEGVDEWYFHEFSEKKAYPMGINIVFYAMTH